MGTDDTDQNRSSAWLLTVRPPCLNAFVVNYTQQSAGNSQLSTRDAQLIGTNSLT